MISALEEFRPVIAALPTGPVAAGPIAHPRISVYAATANGDDVARVQAQVAAIAGGVWERAVGAVDADLRLYELAVERPSTALGDVEAANLISYGMTTVEPGVDVLGLLSLAPARGRKYGDLVKRSLAIGEVGEGESLRIMAASMPIQSCTADPLTLPHMGGEGIGERSADNQELSWLAHGASRDIAALFGAMIAARMANVPVLAAGSAAQAAVALLRALNPQAVLHITEIEPAEFEAVFGLTAAIAGRQ